MQDPLVLWLALTFGGQTVVSETFAIGRIGAVFGLLGSFIIIVVTPKLAGISDGLHVRGCILYQLSRFVAENLDRFILQTLLC